MTTEIPPILVIEDDPEMRPLIARMLGATGHAAITAGSRQEALEVVRSAELKPKIAIVDFILPDTTGKELATEIREILPGISIVFITGYPADALDLFPLDDALILLKPFNLSQLQETISRLA